MKAHARRDIKVQVGVMHPMDAPQRRRRVKPHVLQIDGEVEQYQRCHQRCPWRNGPIVKQAPGALPRHERQAHRSCRKEHPHEPSIQSHDAKLLGALQQVSVIVRDAAADVVLTISNRGKPIPKSEQEVIFEPFFHKEETSATHDPATGLGLGLFVVREIVKAHGGFIELVSEEPEGTTFTVKLPRIRTSR